MATKSTAKPVEEPAGKVQKEPEFTIDKLRENSIKLFGITTSTFDGALCGHKEEKISVKDCKAIIDKWLGREE